MSVWLPLRNCLRRIRRCGLVRGTVSLAEQKPFPVSSLSACNLWIRKLALRSLCLVPSTPPGKRRLTRGLIHALSLPTGQTQHLTHLKTRLCYTTKPPGVCLPSYDQWKVADIPYKLLHVPHQEQSTNPPTYILSGAAFPSPPKLSPKDIYRHSQAN